MVRFIKAAKVLEILLGDLRADISVSEPEVVPPGTAKLDAAPARFRMEGLTESLGFTGEDFA